jgi:outer membrane protein TolC
LLLKIQDLYGRAVRAAEARRKVGIIPTPELNRAKLSYEDARRQVQHVTTQYARAARELNWLMGSSGEPEWRLPDSATADINALPELRDVHAMEDVSQKFRMDLLRADFDRKLTERGIALAKLGLIPQTTVGFDASWDSSHNKFAGPQITSVSIPIFDPGLVGLESAKAQKRRADKTYAALQGQVRQDVRTAFDNWKIAADDVRFFRDQQIPQQEENVRLMELSFRLGNDDLDTLLNVYQSYVSQLQSYEDAIQAYHDAGVALQQAVGVSWSHLISEEKSPASTQPSATTQSAATQPAIPTEALPLPTAPATTEPTL